MAIEKEEPTVLADTGYYNGIEIKNCIDDKMKVYIKKARANNSTKDNEFRKKNLPMIKNKIYTFIQQATHYPFLKTHLRTE